MRKILIVDNNRSFMSDLESRLILEEVRGVDITTAESIDAAFEKVETEDFDEVLMAGSLIGSVRKNSFEVPLSSYARNASELANADKRGIPCYGIVSNTGMLLDALRGGRQAKNITAAGTAVKAARRQERDEDDLFGAAAEAGSTMGGAGRGQYSEESPRRARRQEVYGQEDGDDAYRNESRSYRQDDEPYRQEDRAYREEGRPYRQEDQEGAEMAQKGNAASNQVRSRMEEAKRRKEEERHRRGADADSRSRKEAERAVERDMGNIQEPARVVTVYSAKGGVGKTTISCELATFLALSSRGRGKMKVCIADFNVDFGDVLSTLSFDARGRCMTHWAADIRERLERLPGDHSGGYTDEEMSFIQYSEKEIRYYLQQDERSGLYALLAPITNEDSMELSEEGYELQVMLDNLIHNGGFDYIVCDTGNNTRDASFIPLEKADDIILVLTQNVNTANCCWGFLSTVSKIGFDMGRIKIVINGVKPSKTVRVSIDELTEVMVNPATDEPFECIGLIKDNNDVRSASNMGVPLVFNAGHEFTKSIGEIAGHINKVTFVLEKPEKKKRGLFKKRGRRDEY